MGWVLCVLGMFGLLTASIWREPEPGFRAAVRNVVHGLACVFGSLALLALGVTFVTAG